MLTVKTRDNWKVGQDNCANHPAPTPQDRGASVRVTTVRGGMTESMVPSLSFSRTQQTADVALGPWPRKGFAIYSESLLCKQGSYGLMEETLRRPTLRLSSPLCI